MYSYSQAVPSVALRETVRSASKPSVTPESTHTLTAPSFSLTMNSSIVKPTTASGDCGIQASEHLFNLKQTHLRCLE